MTTNKYYIDNPGSGGGLPNYPLLAPNGSAGAPSYSFTSAPTVGIWYDNSAPAGIGVSLGTTQLTVGAGNASVNTSDVAFYNKSSGSPYGNGFEFWSNGPGSGIDNLSARINSDQNVFGASVMSAANANTFGLFSGVSISTSGDLNWQGPDEPHDGYGSITANTYTTGALSGATVTISNAIPAGCILLGTSARVTTTITGATTWKLGDATTVDAFGTGLTLPSGTVTNIANWSLPASPVYTTNTNIVLTATGANFTGGVVRVTVYYVRVSPPTS